MPTGVVDYLNRKRRDPNSDRTFGAEDTKKRTLHSFFSPPAKKVKSNAGEDIRNDADAAPTAGEEAIEHTLFSQHSAYPHLIAHLPSRILSDLSSFPSSLGEEINDQPDLDLLYFQPYVPKYAEKQLFEFLRSELPFYRVEYDINRGGFSAHIKTPRFTTVFGLDETSRFDAEGNIVAASTGKPITKEPFYAAIAPRPIPACLDALRKSTEAATGCTFNFCLVNYYASGSDSISYHSDDERFLGENPSIASFSLGAKRDFLLKHKPYAPKDGVPPPQEIKPLKLPLGSGDMILMRGRTQPCWLHSIPKRTGKNAEDGGRINITFRKAMVRPGTENYYKYNVGTGPVFRWDEERREMVLWTKS